MERNIKNTSTVRKEDKDDGNLWFRMRIYATRDKRLNFTSLGLLVYLLSHNREEGKFIVHKGVILEVSGLGRSVFNSAWKTLEECGYIIKTKNKLNGTHWHIDYNPENYVDWKGIYKEEDEFIITKK